VIIGKVAHMVGFSADGPRGDPSFPTSDLNRYPNLILLCGNHHDLVDGQPNSYTVDDLRQMKLAHESWVAEQLVNNVPNLTFVELETVAAAILASPQPPNQDLTLVPTLEKIARNGLSDATASLIRLGLAQFNEVTHFVEGMADLDLTYPERLRAGFVNEYQRLRREGLDGDALFQSLLDFSGAGSVDFRRRAAGLVVLTYLFHVCEVFER
jgi:hypothetical protein